MACCAQGICDPDVGHPTYPEDHSIFAQRLAVYQEGCLVMEIAGVPVGYVVSHPGI